MTNKKSTKKALLMSCLSLLLCMSMLVGTTFAWFTDSVSTTNNIITAGNLDVELSWSIDGETFTAVDADTNIFMEGALWEPGHTEVVYLKVANVGTLALKYDLIVNVASETAGTNVAGESFNLSDYILYNVTEGVTDYDTSAEARGDESGNKLNAPYSKPGVLEQGKEVVLTVVVFMPTTVGNEANYLTTTAAPVINMGINLFATQQVKEADSYGPEYDKDADFDASTQENFATPSTIQAMINSAESGAVILLGAGEYHDTIVMKSGITLQGTNGAVVDSINLNGASNVTLKGIAFNAAGAQPVVDGGGTQRSTACVFGATTGDNIGARNIVIDNCIFTGEFANGGAAIAFADRSRPTGFSGNITIQNCTFDTEKAYYDVYGYYTGASGMTFTIKNNTFASDCQGDSIYLGRLKTNEAIVVEGNAFEAKDSIENAVYIQGDSSWNPTLEAANNTFGG